MTHYLRFVTVAAVLIALVVCVPVEAQQDGLTLRDGTLRAVTLPAGEP